MRTTTKYGVYTIGILIVFMIVLLAGICLGETEIPLETVLQVLANRLWAAGYPLDPIDEGIVWIYRLTRTLVAGACGAGLAICGLILQSLLRNPLADPYLLGISAGASTGAVLVIVVGIGTSTLSMSVCALIGAMVSFAFVSLLARLSGSGMNMRGTGQMILAGIAGSQLFNALTSFLIAKSASAEQARGIMFWLLGNLSGVRWGDVQLALPVVGVAILIGMWHIRALDAFIFGSESAASIGVSVRYVQILLITTAAMTTAVMVSIVGSIGFVGLVVPHAARLLFGVRHAVLMPASALMGMVFMIGADIASRTLIPGQALPIGVVTALVGAPIFALILVSRKAQSAC